MKNRIGRKLKNTGFSLIELVVTCALLSIVGGAVASVMVTSQNNYNNGSAETDLQYEAQLLSNQLQDLIIDTARGISYEFSGQIVNAEGDTEDTTSLIIDDSAIGSGTVETKQLYIYDKECYYLIEWNQDSAEIYYTQYQLDNTATKLSETELMAEYVTAFSVDLSEVAENRTVSYTITLEKPGTGRAYTTTHKIKLRNEVLVNTSIEILTQNETKEITASHIEVTPDEEIYVWPGETYTDEPILAKVLSDSGLMPSQSVTWTYDGASQTEVIGNPVVAGDYTKVQANDYLYLAEAERGNADNEFWIYAVQGEQLNTQSADTNGGYEGEYVTVKVRTLTGINLDSGLTVTDETLLEKDGQELTTGGSYMVAASLTGQHLDGLLASDRVTTLQNLGGVTISISAYDKSTGNTIADENEYSTLISTGILSAAPTISDGTTGAGTIDFSVGDVDFKTYTKPVIRVTYTALRKGFNGTIGGIATTNGLYCVSETFEFPITEETTPVDPNGNWKRGGFLTFDFSQYATSLNGNLADKIKVNVKFYNNSGELIKETGRDYSGKYIQNSGADKTSGNWNIKRDMGEGEDESLSIWKLWYDSSKPYNIKLQLTDNVSYGEYYADTHNSGADYTYTKAVITVELGPLDPNDGSSYKTFTYEAIIDPVNIKWCSSIYTDDAQWSDGKDPYNVLVVKDISESVYTAKVYYNLTGGWEDTLQDSLDTSKFVCAVDGLSYWTGSTYVNAYYTQYWAEKWNDYVTITDKTDGNGNSYLEISITNQEAIKELQGKTMTLIYEGDNEMGAYTDDIIINKLQLGGSLSHWQEKNTGCTSQLKLTFATIDSTDDQNIDLSYNGTTLKNAPSVLYCPTPDKLDTMGYGASNTTEYLYLTDEERYEIKKENGAYKITYQECSDATYDTQLEKYTYSWNYQWKKGNQSNSVLYMTYKDGTWQIIQ